MAANGKRLTRLHGLVLFLGYLGFLAYQLRAFFSR